MAGVAVQASLVMVAGLAVAGCEEQTPSHAGSYPGDFEGGYAGLGQLREDGTATSVQLTFTGRADADVSVGANRRLEVSMPGCRLTLAGEDGEPGLAIEGADGDCEILVGGSVGTVPLEEIEGVVRFVEGRIAIELRAAAPPREDGAPPARVTYLFEGQRIP